LNWLTNRFVRIGDNISGIDFVTDIVKIMTIYLGMMGSIGFDSG